ncbi:hypothetical protein R3P38DRAFT_2575729, partial [Favolaschia claudopus]
TGGRLEVSMVREFQRSSGLDGVVSNHCAATLMHIHLVADEKSLSRSGMRRCNQLDEVSSRVIPGNVAHNSEKLDDWIRYGLEHFYNKDSPRVHFLLAANPAPNTEPLRDHARTYEWALLDGRRITPTSRLQGNNPDLGSSIVQARINDTRHVGEIRSIFVHPQSNIDGASETILVAVAWMRRSTHTPLENQPVFIWDKFPELGVETWEYNQYVDPRSHDPPMIMRLADVHCQVSRGRTEGTPKLWITATMDRVSIFFVINIEI